MKRKKRQRHPAIACDMAIQHPEVKTLNQRLCLRPSRRDRSVCSMTLVRDPPAQQHDDNAMVRLDATAADGISVSAPAPKRMPVPLGVSATRETDKIRGGVRPT